MSIIRGSINSLILAGLIFSFAASNKALASEVEISGFVDGSYVSDKNAETSSFGLDKVVIYTSKELGENALIYTDLGFYANNDTTVFTVAKETANEETFEIPSPFITVDQAFLKISSPLGAGFDFTFGKFDAPIGFELTDAPDMFQYSHSLVFEFGIAASHTGLMIDKSFGPVDAKLYLVNGWDNNTDNNKGKTIGARFGFNLVEGLNFGISGVTGPEQDDNNSDKRTLLDVDLTYTGVENLTVGAEFNSGSEDQSAGPEDEWTAFLVMAHYDFLDNLGLTLRLDQFDDSETGSRLGAVTTQQSITVAVTFGLAENLGGLIEFRQDSADEMVFTDKSGASTDSNNVVAIEFTGSF